MKTNKVMKADEAVSSSLSCTTSAGAELNESVEATNVSQLAMPNAQVAIPEAPPVASNASIGNHWSKVQKPRFEIELYDEVTNDYGTVVGLKKAISAYPIIIEAASKADIEEHASRYKMCHQVMKIVRKLDDDPPAQSATPKKQPEQSVAVADNVSQQQAVSQESQAPKCNVEQRKSKPKFYKIGGIEIKDDNGKIYQKQWMRVPDDDMQNFRVINDKNNAIVSLSGKHIEMKKWVLVENDDDANDEEVD